MKTFQIHFLLGTWIGSGSGKFPTIRPFNYKEILTFSCDGFNDLIHYEQRTWITPDNIPSHWESGFIKPIEGKENAYEISNSQDSGRVEILSGQYFRDGVVEVLHFKNKLIQNDPRVLSSERVFRIDKDELSYVKTMATQNTPEHQQHLQATLIKTS